MEVNVRSPIQPIGNYDCFPAIQIEKFVNWDSTLINTDVSDLFEVYINVTRPIKIDGVI